ncbi:hypothetical protein IID21_02795 [Patescibacteria group bacterium]|nr:hypothetical protein [Patescibacteria group bacterium]
MRKESPTLELLNRLAGKNIVDHFWPDFAAMDEKERTKFLLDYAEKVGINPETIDIDGISQIAAKAGDFQEFVDENLREV